MPRSIACLLDQPRGVVATMAVRVGLAAAAGFWLLDAAVDSFLLGGRTLVDELVRPTWSEAWMRVLVAALVVLLYLDRRAGAKLRLLSFVIDEAPDGVQITDLDGRVAYSNRAVKGIYGFSPDELRGKHVNEMNADPEFATRFILPAVQQQGRWAGELDVKHKDGHAFPIWLTTSLVIDARGTPVAAVGIIRDISERKRAEDELRSYAGRLEEATRLKELFADILRHDLIGPAAALRMSIDSLLKREGADAVSKRTLAQATRSCARLTEMIENAGRYAKLATVDQIEFERLDLAALVRVVIADFDPLIADSGTHIVFAANGAFPTRANAIIGDVFANLISNAIKYGPPDGTIDVAITDGGECWVVSVADRGEGIPQPDREKIFTRFERLRKEGVKGSGLGLAIAKHIVELHKGRIWVDDNPAGGSIFRVALAKA